MSTKKIVIYSLYILFLLFSSVAVLGLAEALTRIAWGDQINVQYTDRSLYQDRVYSPNTAGWRPHAVGTCCGKPVTINSLGLRGPEIDLNSNEEKILLIGDSVLFGPALQDSETIAEHLRAKLQACIINTAVIGYNSSHYVDVLSSWISKTKLDRVLVFWCLNDVQNDTSFVQKSTMSNTFDFALMQLRSRSKFYMALKNAISDRSKIYFLYDLKYYQPGDHRYVKAKQDLRLIKNMCDTKNIALDVVILPYEYQIRNRNQSSVWIPQELLKGYFDQQDIQYREISFQEFDGEASKQLYLYADGIHFSKQGHYLIAKQVITYLSSVN
ncbi:hypothetical protein EDS67_24315 [candidate division KSB1 bacterium]|nr:MAG: hypothetical protein EDS67_24315 [candidate division KSB1 bacterium]MBC6950197.1 hypothetical protein [candidate division KSB1 bacterium]MCE7941733.1 hypothetical protein [Chlorobi bacterium CHB1]MDL1875391.1 hypothetical protein [Cytophagia bacterium CHB2]